MLTLARKFITAFLLSLTLFISPSFGQSQGSMEDRIARRQPVQVTWNQPIPTRDGIKLSATVYRPLDQKNPLPVILMITPYIAAHAARQGNYFARNGYVFVAMDMRGRGNSEGSFLPGEVEAKDGYDSVEFLARQPWCNGQVAMWGGSWLGFTQWSIAKEFPPHLKAIAPTASVYPGIDYPNPGGIFTSYMLRWLTWVNGRSGNDGIFNESKLWENIYWTHYERGLPFEQLDEVSGITNTVFRKWLAHPHLDAFWDAMTPSEESYRKLSIPVLTITGHYDADQLGALTYYRRHMQFGAPEVIKQHYLVIGPYDHPGTRRPKDEVGGLKVGAAAVLDMEKLHKEWFDHVLKGQAKPAFLKDRIAYFVMGDNNWRYLPIWDNFLGEPLSLYLGGSESGGNEVFQAGTLKKTPSTQSGLLQLVLDPKKSLDREWYDLDAEDPNFILNQRSAYIAGEKNLFFHSDAFPEDIEISGIPNLRLWIESDVPDADLQITLTEVRPDGTAVALSECQLRLRYREDLRNPQLLPINRPVEIAFKNFNFFSKKISKGSRIRMTLGNIASPNWEQNPHTGGVVAKEGKDKARVATLRILTDPQHASVLHLPRPKMSATAEAVTSQ